MKALKAYPEDCLEVLEFDKVLDRISGFCCMEVTKESIASLKPGTDFEHIDWRLSLYESFSDHLNTGSLFPSFVNVDIRESLKHLRIENYLLPVSAFIQLRKFSSAVSNWYDLLEELGAEDSAVIALVEDIGSLPAIHSWISEIMDDEGKVHSKASPELARIRRQLVSKKVEIDKVFKRSISHYKKKGFLTDTLQSIRNGRRVLSVFSEHKRQISGISHDESESGKTTFIEPESVVQLNNEIFELERSEFREIKRLLLTLTQQIAPLVDLIEDHWGLLIELDSICAICRYGIKLNAVKPKVVNDQVIDLRIARHPILLDMYQDQGKEVVPLNLELIDGHQVLLISGPNAGGKSVALKSIGLMQLMLQSGIPVPVHPQSTIGLFTQILTDLGDSQSIEDELSTYSSRMKRMKHFMKNVDDKSLFLIDEFGSGTDPALGGPMAQAILSDILDKRPHGIVTTHYGNLKSFAEEHPLLVNGSMQFDEGAILPLFSLEVGKPGRSYTFNMAYKSGIPRGIINKAKKLADSGQVDYERLLKKLEKDRLTFEKSQQEFAREQEDVRDMFAKLEKQQNELDDQRRRLRYEKKQQKIVELGQIENRIKEVLKELAKEKSTEKAAQKKLQEIREEKEQLAQSVEVIQDQVADKKQAVKAIQEGDEVRMVNSEKTGTVLEIRKKKAIVLFGILKSEVALNQLEHIENSPKDNVVNTSASATHDLLTLPPERELDLRGMRKDEALLALESFMEQALIHDLHELSIIHGRGTGAIKQLTVQTVRKYKAVKEYYHPDQKGGDDLLVVKL